MQKAKKANKPSDASSMIEMDVELHCLQLKGAREFYNDVVGVMDQYGQKDHHELCMLMARNYQDALYARLILDERKSNSPDFDMLYNDVSEIQRLTRSRNKGSENDKEVSLSSVDRNGNFSRKCFNCGKACGYRAKECRKCKGDLKGSSTGQSEGGNTGNSGSKKMCNFCGVKGHKESQCFKKNPQKAPAWWKAKNDKAESAIPSVEVMLTLIANSDIIRVDIMALQAEKGNTMDILHNKNVWICDTGASVHVTWNSDMAKRALVWLSEKTGKTIFQLEEADFFENQLTTLVQYYNNDVDTMCQAIFDDILYRIDTHTNTLLPVNTEEKVLVMSPHPDDDVISCGNTLLSLINRRKAKNITVAYQTSGCNAVSTDEMKDHLRFTLMSAKGLN